MYPDAVVNQSINEIERLEKIYHAQNVECKLHLNYMLINFSYRSHGF